MATILSISSYLASGCVGLNAAVPVYQRLGHDVIALPTTLLSNHPGHPAVAASAVDPALLTSMVETLGDLGRLDGVRAVSTGYLPSPAHVDVALLAIETVKRQSPGAFIHCDPIIGDDPEGVYIDIAAAEAIKRNLIRYADLLTPNAFELRWLTNRSIATIPDAVSASRALTGAAVAATSIPDSAHTLANVLSANDLTIAARVEKRRGVPHGTGDVFAALLLAHILAGEDYSDALSRAAAGVDVAIRANLGRLDLSLVASLDPIVAARGAAPDVLE